MAININGNVIDSTVLTPDLSVYKNTFRKVTLDMIDSYEIPNSTLVYSQNDSNGFYTIKAYHNGGGCGSPAESGVWVKIKTSIPWSRVVCDFTVKGSAACWGFNGNGYGQFTDQSGNLQSYSTASGDIIFGPDAINAFENTAYTIKASACDNDANNFMRFNTSSDRTFTMFSRRNNLSNLAGPLHGRSCNSTGVDSYTIISNIYIF